VKKLIVFDLDGTLAASKAPVDPEMSGLLHDLLGIVKVAVISGGGWPQFEKQLVSNLPHDKLLANLSLLVHLLGDSCVRLSKFRALIYSPLYGISLFLPSIIAELGYSGPHAQLLTVPVYVCACVVCILMAYLSDRAQRRGVFIFGLLSLALVGFIIAMTAKEPGAKYAGVFIAASGSTAPI